MTDVKKHLGAIEDLRTPDEWEAIRRRLPRTDLSLDTSPSTIGPAPIRRVGIIVLALMIAAAGSVFAVHAFRTSVVPGSSPTPVAPSVHDISLEPGVGHTTFAFGSIWVVEPDGVTRIDPNTGGVVARIPVDGITAKGDGGAPDWSGITSGAGLVWVTAEPQILGIDPSTNDITERIAEESGVANITFAGGLIVVGGSGEGIGDVRLLDPATKEYAHVLNAQLSADPSVLVSTDWYWAGGEPGESVDSALTRMSKDGSIVQAIAGVPMFDSFAEAGGSLWVTGGNKLYQVDESFGGPPASPPSVFPEQADAVTATFPIGGPGEAASDGSTLWLLERPTDGTARVTQLDPATGLPIADPVAIDHRGPAELVVANGEPWVSFRDDGTLVTLAPLTGSSAPPFVPRVTAEIPLPADTISYGIAVGAGAVWAGAAPSHAANGGSLLRIDPATNAITGSIDLQGAPFREQIAPTDQAVWIARSGQVLRLDPNTMQIAAAIDLPAGTSAIAADATSVWAAVPTAHALVRIDPTTNAIAATIPIGEAITGYADEVRIGAGAVWVLGSSLVNENRENGGDLVRVDPNTNQVVDRIPVSGFQMVIGPDGVWVRSPADGVFDQSGERWVWRIVDPATDQPSAPFSFEDDGLKIVTADALWSVGYGENDNVVVTRFDPDSLQPVVRSAPIRSLMTDAAIDLPSGTVWIAANDSIVRVDIAAPSSS